MDRLDADLKSVMRGIDKLRAENAELRRLVARNEMDIKLDYEKLMEEYQDELSRCWMCLSPKEDARLREFREKHYQLHKKDNGFISHIFGTGIGTCYAVECPICHEKEDITDTSSW